MEVAESIAAQPIQVGDTLDDLDDILSTADNLAEALDINPCKSNSALEPINKCTANGDLHLSDDEIKQNGIVVLLSEDEDHQCQSDTIGESNDRKTEDASLVKGQKEIVVHEHDKSVAAKQLKNGPKYLQANIENPDPQPIVLNGDTEEHIDEENGTKSPYSQASNRLAEKDNTPIEILDSDSEDDARGGEDPIHKKQSDPPIEAEHNQPEKENSTEQLDSEASKPLGDIPAKPESLDIKRNSKEACSGSETTKTMLERNDQTTFDEAASDDNKQETKENDADSDVEMIDPSPVERRDVLEETPGQKDEKQDADSDIEMIELDTEADKKATTPTKISSIDDVKLANHDSACTSAEMLHVEIMTGCENAIEANSVDASHKEGTPPHLESKEDSSLCKKSNDKPPAVAQDEKESSTNVANNDEALQSAEDIVECRMEEPSTSHSQIDDEVDMNISEALEKVEIQITSEIEAASDTPMQIDEPGTVTQPKSPGIIELSDDDSKNDSNSQPKAPSPELEGKTANNESESVSGVDSKSFARKMFEAKPGPSTAKLEEQIEEQIQSVSSSDDEESIYYDKECINYECVRDANKFYKAPQFILNFYKMQKKTNKIQFVCNGCFDNAVKKFEVLTAALQAREPLLKQDIPKRQDFVEILDSSDEEGDEDEKIKGEQELDPDTIEMLSRELDAAIEEIIDRVDAKQQVAWTKSMLSEKLVKMEAECEEITESLRQLQNSADKMHTALYQCPKIKIKELPPLDLNTGRQFKSETESTLPALGELKYPPIEVNGTYYAVRNKAIASWLSCRVIDSMDVVISGQKSVKYYKVKYLRIKVPTVKCVSAKHMAYGDAPNVRLSIGTRVIALFDGSTLSKNNKETIAPSAFYPGVVAEQLQAYNKYRYLIFFDDGYAQYVHHKDVRVVCQVAENVWEDVHPASREFIHNYLSQYQKHRPMVQVKKGQSMITESNGKWLYAKVIDVDASLVQMQFDGQSRYEWIYRGSTRLGPLFKEKQSNGTANAPASIPRRSEPFVRYDEDTTRNDNTQSQEQQQSEKQQATRAVAKKSTARQDSQQSSSSQAPVKHLNNSTIFLEDDNRPKGKVVYYTAKKNLPPKPFTPHDCKPSCLFSITHNLHSYSPLAKPLLSGWERQIFKSKLKKSVVYRAPCGRRIRNMEELHRYLRLTKNVLNVDNFDFDCAIHCLAEYVIDSSIISKADLSNGVENMVIPCINYYDNTMPPHCDYSLERIPTEGVNMNLDPNFLVGCDCEDDCLDKSKCSCWQLTISGGRFGNPNTPPENVGYWFKRLLDPVPTGIYECNVNCKCSKDCLNRVVQNPLQVKLQVFKTSNRGWGLRCLNDISKGTFICIYAGHLLTEQKANEGGVNASDEYFAELDYIEVVERLKEGYESDVQDDNESEDEDIEEPNPDADSDEDFHSKCNVNNKDASINTRLRTRRGTSDEDKSSKKARVEGVDDSQERQVLSFEPNTSLGNEEHASANTKYRSIRKYFGKNEFCYIMDAKKIGNIGRYFNHSCSPNLFVQNVFVDTQDLRFPWVAFFALTHIRAGTELTWNYNYEVGIVPGKVLYCECGAPNCRGRLL